MKTKLFHLFVCGLIAAVAAAVPGCGYTTKTSLPEHIRSVHVAKVPNRIDITGEVSSDKPFQTYRPGLETELRNAIIERFIFDGHLRVVPAEKADALLVAELLSFDRDPVRYESDDSIQEFRIHVTASVEFKDAVDNKVIYHADSLSGEGSYYLSGSLASSEDEAVQEALEDLTRRAVENILEVW